MSLPGYSSATMDSLSFETAEKIVKAIKHGAKPCGGKSDPF